jgi:hypothetical protein
MIGRSPALPWNFQITNLLILNTCSISTTKNYLMNTASASYLMDPIFRNIHSESIRIFHVYSVEMNWEISQFDVPQAFLQSPIDHTMFVYPPRSHVKRPGQILEFRLALYGSKLSSALFYKILNAFLFVDSWIRLFHHGSLFLQT